MAHEIVELECPGCAAPISTATKICPYCSREIVITTFNSITGMSPMDLNKQANAYRKVMASHPDNDDLNMSIAFCYLKLKLYDKAIPCFEKALEENFDNSEAYFYAAICLLKGQKAFTASRSAIEKIEEYMNAAIMIEPRGIYYYFLAYIKYDYYQRKYYKTTPNYKELLIQANRIGYSDTDVSNLYSLLEVSRPSAL